MKTIDGKVIKEHNGLYNYTIGQRKGLDIGGLKDYPPAPWFVIGKDLSANVLYVGQGYHNEYLYSNNCIVKMLFLEVIKTWKTASLQQNLDTEAKMLKLL